MKSKLSILLIALLLGATDAVIFKVFEYIVNHGTQYIWNDVFHSDIERWRVIPLALVFGLLLSGLFVLLKQQRLVQPKINSVEEEKSVTQPTLISLGIIFLIGVASLLAGASLGPEASLVAMVGGLGIWSTYTLGNNKVAKLMQLASIGALLVAFFGSYILVLLPLAMLLKNKKLSPGTAAPVLLAGASSYGALWLMDHNTAGYGTIPVSGHYGIIDFPLAAILGMATAFLGWLLKRYIIKIFNIIKPFDNKKLWVVTGSLYGSVIGILYFIGGQSVQFSGSEGSHLIVNHSPAYGVWALIVILLAKLLVTGWSLGSGYRGGLVFPSVFIGVTIALIAEQITGVVNPGVMVGSIAGVFGALVGPVPAFIFILGLLPIDLIGVALVGIIFATIANKTIAKFIMPQPE